jgi:hypothetical protein
MRLIVALAAALAQQPQIQNGVVEVRRATRLDRDLAAIPASARSSAFTWLGRSRDPRAVAFIDSLLR